VRKKKCKLMLRVGWALQALMPEALERVSEHRCSRKPKFVGKSFVSGDLHY
jgi:hypothetical protein